ncbi:MAG: bifunctional UDP-sugar hydrolase/5'-nucleotidase [Spirochaetota bacterium]
MKRLFGILALVTVMFAFGCVGAPEPAPVVALATVADTTEPLPPPLLAEVELRIIHTNDMHARALENRAELGYARISTLVKQLKAENPNTLVIDAGDTFHGLPFANLERGSSIAKLLNAVGYDYMTVGNHDFNYGQARLLELEKEINFPILAANVYKNGKRLFKAYEVKNIGGIRVGVFGLASPETSYKTDPKGIEGITFTDPVEEARKVVAELKPQVDMIVLISHIGMDESSDPTSLKIASAVEGLDVIIDGHSHTSLETVIAKNKTHTLIAQAGDYGKALGVVDVVVSTDRKVVSKGARSLTMENSPGLVADPDVKAIGAAIGAAQAPMLAEKVGTTSVLLLGVRNDVRTSQTNLGTLVANSMMDISGADIALMNGGGIRESIPAGDILKENIFKVLPFGNYAQTIEVTGADIKAALENGVGKLPAPDGRYPHVAGATFSIDVAKPVGSRVSNIVIKGQPIDMSRIYILAAPNFTINGGDEYTMFVGKKLVNEYPSDAEVFMAYVRKLGVISDSNL